jgi:hypothetical protein
VFSLLARQDEQSTESSDDQLEKRAQKKDGNRRRV